MIGGKRGLKGPECVAFMTKFAFLCALAGYLGYLMSRIGALDGDTCGISEA